MLSQTSSVAGGSKEVVAVESETTAARWDLAGDNEDGGEVRMGKRVGSSSSVVSPRRTGASTSSEQDRAR